MTEFKFGIQRTFRMLWCKITSSGILIHRQHRIEVDSTSGIFELFVKF